MYVSMGPGLGSPPPEAAIPLCHSTIATTHHSHFSPFFSGYFQTACLHVSLQPAEGYVLYLLRNQVYVHTTIIQGGQGRVFISKGAIGFTLYSSVISLTPVYLGKAMSFQARREDKKGKEV